MPTQYTLKTIFVILVMLSGYVCYSLVAEQVIVPLNMTPDGNNIWIINVTPHPTPTHQFQPVLGEDQSGISARSGAAERTEPILLGVAGDVTVAPLCNPGQAMPGDLNMILHVGDVVSVGKNSIATVQYDGKFVFVIKANSAIVIGNSDSCQIPVVMQTEKPHPIDTTTNTPTPHPTQISVIVSNEPEEIQDQSEISMPSEKSTQIPTTYPTVINGTNFVSPVHTQGSSEIPKPPATTQSPSPTSTPEMTGIHYETGLIIPGEVEQTESQPSSHTSCSWEGSWDSDFGTVTLTQKGTIVTGVYDEDGIIEGITDGDVFTGTWSEQPSYSPPNDAGSMKLVMNKDCTSFSGQWMYGSGGSWAGGWNGDRI